MCLGLVLLLLFGKPAQLAERQTEVEWKKAVEAHSQLCSEGNKKGGAQQAGRTADLRTLAVRKGQKWIPGAGGSRGVRRPIN